MPLIITQLRAMAKLILFAAVLLLAPWAVSVYASAPPPLPNCNDVIIKMIGCVDFVLDGSNETKPSSECCGGVKTVVGVGPTCLCEALQTAVNMGYEVNMTRAGVLTESCNVDVPGFNGCGGATPPAPAPAPTLSSPSPSPLPSPPPSGSSPAPPVSPPLPTPEPPSPAPSPALPVSPPLPSQPSPAPEIPPVGSPIEAEAPSTESASARASTPLGLIAGAAAAGFALFLAV